jgi:hypothetical protein
MGGCLFLCFPLHAITLSVICRVAGSYMDTVTMQAGQ